MTSENAFTQTGKQRYGAGDTYLVRGVLPPDAPDVTFERLKEEVQWCTMSHRGGEVPRLVAVQGAVDADGTIPIYRHPADESPPLLAFTPTVSLIREHVSRYLPAGGHPPLNHVLIQLYRTGEDYISEHSDKTVDIVQGSCIVNVSLGAQRMMTLRTKEKKNTMPDKEQHRFDSKPSNSSPQVERTTQKIPLPHNSAFVMGLETNREWLHSIRADRRPDFVLSQPETAFGRERISLTFRSIGTFLTPVDTNNAPPQEEDGEDFKTGKDATKWLIWGQGARNKMREHAAPPVSSKSVEERDALLHAFGSENHFSDFDWEDAYGRGFDVLHFTDS